MQAPASHNRSVVIGSADVVWSNKIGRRFMRDGWNVRVCDDAASVLIEVTEAVDIFLLDTLIPLLEISVLCEHVRAACARTAAVIVVYDSKLEPPFQNDLHSVVDDMISKSASHSEVLWRVRNALQARQPEAYVEAKGLRIDVISHRAYAAGHLLRLTPLEYRLLLFFAERPEHDIELDEIARAVWRHPERLSSATYRVTIGRLNGKLRAHHAACGIHSVGVRRWRLDAISR